MTLDEFKLTIARTTGESLDQGTAFLISETHALTCAHCVKLGEGQAAETVSLYFSCWEDGNETSASVDAVDFDQDVALLRLDKPAPVTVFPRSAKPPNEARWKTFGHPAPTGKHGLVIDGTVMDVNASTGSKLKRRVMQLRCRDAADAVSGSSGSPVLVKGHIVGMITNQAMMYYRESPGEARGVKPAYNALYALTLEEIGAGSKVGPILEWGELKELSAAGSVDETRSEEELFESYREIIESIPKYSSVKVPGSDGAIETAPLNAIYVEPQVVGVSNVEEIWDRRRVAVLGEGGIGKGAFLKHLQLLLLRRDDPNERLWPLHCELDRYVSQDEEPDLVGFTLNNLLPAEEDAPLRKHLEICAKEGRLVLLCDGLQHVGSEYGRVVDALSRQRRFIVAVRPEQPTDVGQESGATLRLRPFNRERIAEFIFKWGLTFAADNPDFDAKKIQQEIQKKGALELARNPGFLGLICADLAGGGSLALTSTAVVSNAWKAVWEASFGNESYSRRRAVATALQRAATQSLGLESASGHEFDESELFDYLTEAGETEAEEVVERLVAREIIAPTEGLGFASRSFSFSFDRFQEYLAAEQLANDKTFIQGVPDLQIDSRWSRILPIVTGILGRDKRRLDTLQTVLASLADLSGGEALGHHVCLLGECLTEVHPELIPALQPFPDQTAAEIVRTWTQDPFARNRMLPLFRHLQLDAIRTGLRRALGDAEIPQEHRAAAAIAFGSLNDAEAVESLRQVLREDPSSAVRSAACLGLALCQDDSAGPALVTALSDADTQVRMTAARCISRQGDRDLAPAVLEAWLDSAAVRAQIDNMLVRAMAEVFWFGAITNLRPEAVLPILLEYLTAGRNEEQAIVIPVMGGCGARAAISPLISILESEESNDDQRLSAALALAQLETDTSIFALDQAIRRGDDAAKMGALTAYSAAELMRNSPAAELFVDPAGQALSWSIVEPLELEIFEAQAKSTREQVEGLVEEDGLEAVIAKARKEFEDVSTLPAGTSSPDDMLHVVGQILAPSDGDDLTRFAAFEILQYLDGSPELAVAALGDPDLLISTRAAVWIKARGIEVPFEALLDRLDEIGPNSLAFAGGFLALTSLKRLPLLIQRYKEGSVAASFAIWVLASRYGFRLYDDGRIETPDGCIETDYEVALARLRSLRKAADRQPDSDFAELREAADLEFQAARGTSPVDAAGWASAAAIADVLENYQSGIEFLAKAIETEPQSPLWHRFLGHVHFNAGHYEEAIKNCDRAMELGDSSAACYFELGRALTFGEVDLQRGEAMLTTAIEKDPSHTQAKIGRAIVRTQLSRVQEAIDDLSEILAAEPGHHIAEQLLAALVAEMAESAGDGVVGVDGEGFLLQPADPEDWEEYLEQALKKLAAGDLDGAHTDAKRVIVAFPFHPLARVIRARVWIEKGMPEAAIVDLGDLPHRCSNDHDREALAAALNDLVELGSADPSHRLYARGTRGVVFAMLDRFEKSREDLEAALAGGATTWQILCSLSQVYINHDESNLERATELAREALDLLGDSMYAAAEDRWVVLRTLADSLEKRGMREEALTVMQQADSLVPDSPQIK